MRSEDVEEVRRLRLFRDIAPARLEALLRGAFLQRFPAHVELVREGERADFLHVVVDGRVEMFCAYRDRETTVGVLGPGQSFILAAVLLDRLYLKSARSLLPSRILMIPAEAIREGFAVDPVLARGLGEELALAYRDVVKELKNQKLRTGLERLANWLLTRNAETGSTGRFELPFDKKVLAARLGMAPEALSRAFAALAAYQVVVQGPSVAIKDAEALRKLAHPSALIDDPTY
jgi:CRP/FNR family transcriptional activator FtrB